MKYHTFTIMAKFGDFSRWFEITAVDLQAASNDLFAAYGEHEIVTYSSK